ncbi:DegT/DnrJ/EryC1/StrS family aminotransferase [Lentisalinibacter salinarum]|uniref:DegT/DnrJ/EryC1/StrS family aminotransferase n=1 Tax=Lentisalinibacter salinarum TaxID=2992239 RepID=UPI0038659986
MADNGIYVTRPRLPPLNELVLLLEEVWERQIVTNEGPLLKQFERMLSEYLDLPHIAIVNNGTTALILALQALELSGEVITTPFSFVATSHALRWAGLDPVFIDIAPGSPNLDPALIEAAITPRTSAILAVHCYGYPCASEAIDEVGAKYGLKVIYDAAHAFGVTDREGSILRYGDLSVLSLHATKVFNSIEGGAVVCKSSEMKERIDQLKNFGIADEVSVPDVGLNGKLSELHAAVGVLQLKSINADIERRRRIAARYRQLLKGAAGIRLLDAGPGVSSNGAYFPIFLDCDFPLSRDELHDLLKANDIGTRRYFFPLISSLPSYRSYRPADPKRLPVAETAAAQVLCLPIYPSLALKDVDRIVSLIVSA